jgi:hypothetical protein
MDLSCIAKLFCQELQEVRKALNSLVSLLGENVKVLAEIYKTQFTKEIKNDQYRTTWENFSVSKLTPILNNNLSVEAACQVRVHVCFGTVCKFVYYVNGDSAYLNQAIDLTADCGYVFDISVNPGDTLNFAASFDDSVFTTITCKFIRLQEVR